MSRPRPITPEQIAYLHERLVTDLRLSGQPAASLVVLGVLPISAETARQIGQAVSRDLRCFYWGGLTEAYVPAVDYLSALGFQLDAVAAGKARDLDVPFAARVLALPKAA